MNKFLTEEIHELIANSHGDLSIFFIPLINNGISNFTVTILLNEYNDKTGYWNYLR